LGNRVKWAKHPREVPLDNRVRWARRLKEAPLDSPARLAREVRLDNPAKWAHGPIRLVLPRQLRAPARLDNLETPTTAHLLQIPLLRPITRTAPRRIRLVQRGTALLSRSRVRLATLPQTRPSLQPTLLQQHQRNPTLRVHSDSLRHRRLIHSARQAMPPVSQRAIRLDNRSSNNLSSRAAALILLANPAHSGSHRIRPLLVTLHRLPRTALQKTPTLQMPPGSTLCLAATSRRGWTVALQRSKGSQSRTRTASLASRSSTALGSEYGSPMGRRCTTKTQSSLRKGTTTSPNRNGRASRRMAPLPMG
jgi:hypothetical protein